MLSLKTLLTEDREKSLSWLSPSGRVIPVKDTHMTTARKLLPYNEDPMMGLWRQGYLRVTWMYDGTLIAHNELQPPNNKQIAVLKDLAIEGEHSKVEYDGGDKTKIIWSQSDILQEEIRNSIRV